MRSSCEFCNKTFANSRSLASHRYTFHRKKNTSETEVTSENESSTSDFGDQNVQTQKKDSSDRGNFIRLILSFKRH